MPSIFKNTRFDPYRNTRSNRSACPVLAEMGSDESIQAPPPPPQPTTRMGRAVAPIRNKVFVPMRRVTKRVTSKSYFPLVFIWVLFGFLAVVGPVLWRNIKREEYYKNNMMNQMYNRGPEAEQARWAYMYSQQGGAAAGNYYGGGNPQGGYYGGAAGAQGGYYGAAGAQGGYYGGEPGGYYGGEPGGYYGANAAGGYYQQGPQEMEQYWRNNVDFNGCRWYQLNCQASYNQRGFETNPSWYSGWGNNQNQAAAYQNPEAARRGYYNQQTNNLGALYFVYFVQLILFILLLVYGFRVITKNLPRGGLIGMLLLWSVLSFLMMWLLADNSISHEGFNFFDQFSVLMFMTDFWYMLFGFAFALILGVLCRRVVQRPQDPTSNPVEYQAYEEPKPVAQAPAVAQCPAAVPAPAPAPAVVSTPTGPRDPVARTPPQSPAPSDDFVRVV